MWLCSVGVVARSILRGSSFGGASVVAWSVSFAFRFLLCVRDGPCALSVSSSSSSLPSSDSRANLVVGSGCDVDGVAEKCIAHCALPARVSAVCVALSSKLTREGVRNENQTKIIQKTCIVSCTHQALAVRKRRYKRPSVLTFKFYCKNKVVRQKLLEEQWQFS